MRKSLSGAGALNAELEDVKRRKPAKKKSPVQSSSSSSSSSSNKNVKPNLQQKQVPKKKSVPSTDDGHDDPLDSKVWLSNGSLGQIPCAICSNVVEEPMRNPACGHIFCLECISATLTNQGKGKKQCPSCSVTIKTTKLQAVKDKSKKVRNRNTAMLNSKMNVLLKEINEIKDKDASEKSLILYV